MTALALSRHAEARMNQRGMRRLDRELILRCGSEIDGDIHDVYYLSRKAVERAINMRKREIHLLKHPRCSLAGLDRECETRRLKREIQSLERLRNWKLVVADKTVVTCYRSNRRDQKRIFRKAR